MILPILACCWSWVIAEMLWQTDAIRQLASWPTVIKLVRLQLAVVVAVGLARIWLS